jgi:hypothetical protein
VFKGILDNRLFMGIWLVTSVLQVLIVQYGSDAFHVAKDGLSAKYWGLSMILGAASLVVQQVINVAYNMCQSYKIYKNKKRKSKYGHMTKERTNGQHSQEHPHSE